jgi:anti-sigma regulatory factor (Ser/Thr protein kinase)
MPGPEAVTACAEVNAGVLFPGRAGGRGGSVRSAPHPDRKDGETAVPRQMRFGVDNLRPVRQVTARWSALAGLPPGRAEDFVIAVNEIATNAVRYGSPTAGLALRVTRENMAEAEVRDDGRWPPGSMTAPAGEDHGRMGLALVRRVCDAVEIRAGDNGTTVILRMRLNARRRHGPGGGGRIIRAYRIPRDNARRSPPRGSRLCRCVS